MIANFVINVMFLFFFYGSHGAKFIIKNNCPYTIWPATLTSKGAQLSTGFELASQASSSLDVQNSWSGRIWARYHCSKNGKNFTCLSGDCDSGEVACNGKGPIPPETLLEFTIVGYEGKDFYDISLVDGFNLPVSIKPLNRGDCNTTSCPIDINKQGCPNDLAVRNPVGGSIIGCKSACVAYQQPQYCCTGSYGSPQTCKPTRYSRQFKHFCPLAYTYAYDDQNSTFTCIKVDYMITFCP
uniref:Thaumatin-like protein n=1 Tax=Solanum lycopersicum TaxID=4081 RepID=A0A3Q7I2L3_SOLLC|nr:thaumatin-like protein 1 [Solanum lycopersicum]